MRIAPPDIKSLTELAPSAAPSIGAKEASKIEETAHEPGESVDAVLSALGQHLATKALARPSDQGADVESAAGAAEAAVSGILGGTGQALQAQANLSIESVLALLK